ncbi:hypothetical protein [Sporosarcina globispora]|uniref:hypothetical protein n=1 Tax=Sporosarcina globispora TaxID=1459 RepID=UPI000B28EFA1|nr:hypothetical protein [Sporosarcina globispora]
MVNILYSIVGIFIIYIVIAILWQLAELRLYGKITPRKLDGLVAIILAVSLFFNLK